MTTTQASIELTTGSAWRDDIKRDVSQEAVNYGKKVTDFLWAKFQEKWDNATPAEKFGLTLLAIGAVGGVGYLAYRL